MLGFPGFCRCGRPMHRQVRADTRHPSLRMWLEIGLREESADRDGDGVIEGEYRTSVHLGPEVQVWAFPPTPPAR